ncbi:VRR-NUC domain protein [Brachyspira pilosicoli]|nr:VRR-NUC domain protein [Brachyspira pilosicoli]
MTSVDFDSLLKNIEMEQRDPQPLKKAMFKL